MYVDIHTYVPTYIFTRYQTVNIIMSKNLEFLGEFHANSCET